MSLELIQKIGEGSYGVVYLANVEDPKTGQKMVHALKKIEKNARLYQNKKRLNNEINILKFIKQCDYVIQFYSCDNKKDAYWLYFEYCNGLSLSNTMRKLRENLSKTITKNYKTIEGIIQYYMVQIVKGIKYLHQHNIIHRDIKPDNILVKFDSDNDYTDLYIRNSKIKIADFGFATILNKTKSFMANSVLGTLAYTPPEIAKAFKLQEDKNTKNNHNTLNDKIDYGFEVDIWSLGVLFYELLFNKKPFQTREDMIQSLEKKQYTIPRVDGVSIESLDFLFMMLQYDKKDRLTIEKLSQHPFILNNYNTFNYNSDKSKIQSTFSMERNGKTLWDLWGIEKPALQNININEINYSSLGIGNSINESKIIFIDYFPEIIEKKNYNNFQHKKEEKQEQNDNNNNVVINSARNQLIQQCFDEMNEIFSYINPEIIPMYPNQSKIDKYDLEIY